MNTLGKYAAALVPSLLMASPVRAQTPTAPPPVFAQCSGCHSIQPGRHVFGPSLAGVAGRRAGSVADYAYSQALKGSGLTWNAATLDRWLTAPQKLVPGTRMPFGGIPDKARRKAVIDFLLTLPD